MQLHSYFQRRLQQAYIANQLTFYFSALHFLLHYIDVYIFDIEKKCCLAVLFFIVFCYFEESGRHFVTVNCLTTKTKSLITNLFAYVTTGSIRDARKNSAAQ